MTMADVVRTGRFARRAGLKACMTAVLAALTLMPVLAQAPAPPSPASRFPAGPGRDALFKVCSNCHGPESVLGQLKTRDEWGKTLDDMANNGAQGSEEEWNQILEYLVQHYSLIFVNKATAKELESTLDVAPPVAEAIVRRRADRGPYASIDDLEKVPGVVATAIEARKDRLIF
jgi:competence protein ComEA